MLAKFNLMKPLVVGGAVAAAIAVTPVAAAETFAAGPGKAASRVSVAVPVANSGVRVACRVVPDVFRVSVAAPAMADRH
jgi:hypothetical protein